MVVAFPLGKILYLVVRQVSKPISVRLQRVAKQTPFVRNYVIMPTAQAFHKLEMFIKMRLMGAKGPAQVQPLKEERAIEVGAELIGEAFIFSVAAVFVLYEYNKSVKKEAQKEAARKKDLQEMKLLLSRLDKDVELVKGTLERTGVLKKSEEQPGKVNDKTKPTAVAQKQVAKSTSER